MIKLQITRDIDNPNYDKEYDEQRSSMGFGGMYNEKYDDMHKRRKTVQAGVLEVEITEEQFSKIRAEVLKVF
jgi:hypothetical protein